VPLVVMKQIVTHIMFQPDASTPLRSAQHDKRRWGKPPPYKSAFIGGFPSSFVPRPVKMILTILLSSAYRLHLPPAMNKTPGIVTI
jgi:hypothetical protein